MSAIKAGDLVYITDFCCTDELVGTVHTVTRFHSSARCPLCKTIFMEPTAELNGDGWGHIVRWLRRIPPLSELRYADRFEEEKV